MRTPAIKEKRTWTKDSVRRACIDNDLYTDGSNEDYAHMLQWVNRLYPNTENLYFIAEDIMAHSTGQTIANIMYVLANQAVTTTFEIGKDNPVI